MAQSIGVGFLAAGPATQAIHLPVLATMPGTFHVARIMDIDRKLAEAIAARCGAEASTNADEVFFDPDVDVVAICSPNAFHASQVIAACEAEKRAVLCEKPLAVTMAEAEAIKTASRASGTAIFVNTMHAYDPAYQAALAAWQATGDTAMQIRSGIFLPGNDEFVNQATEQQPLAVSPRDSSQAIDLALRKQMMRAAMLGLAIHDLPLVRDFQPRMGRLLAAEYLQPFGYSVLSELDGQTTELTALMPGNWPPKWTFDVVGLTHRLRASMPPSYVRAGSARVELEGPLSTQVFSSEQNGYEAVWEAVARTVRDGVVPPVSIDTALADLAFSLDVADAIDQMEDMAS